jgi:putative flippase GtrA
MALIETALNRVPEPLRSVLIKHRELLKFAVVGAINFVVTVAVNYALKLTILNEKPVTALAIAVVIATIVSYILNREWSFRTRGGRERHHEAALFFLINGIGVGLNSLPLAVSRYLLHLQVPQVTLLAQETADFVSGMILGTVLASAFRLWGYKKWVFPHADARPRVVRGAGRAGRDGRDGDERAA